MRSFVVFTIFALQMLVFFPSFCAAEQTEQRWEIDITRALTPTRDLRVEVAGRSDTSITNANPSSIDLGVSFRTSQHWRIFPRFRHIEAEGRRPAENRWHLDFQYSDTWGPWRYDLRTTYEYRSFTNRTTNRRITGRVRGYLPIGGRDSLMVKTRMFYDLGRGAWTTLLPAIGIRRRFSKRHSLEVYYGQDIRRATNSWKRQRHVLSMEYLLSY